METPKALSSWHLAVLQHEAKRRKLEKHIGALFPLYGNPALQLQCNVRRAVAAALLTESDYARLPTYVRSYVKGE